MCMRLRHRGSIKTPNTRTPTPTTHPADSPQLSTTMTEEVEHPIIRSSTSVRAFHNLGDVCAVAVFPDTRRMAMNSSDGMLRLWDLKTGVMLKEMEGRGDAMRDVALSRDGQLIASSDDAGYVTAWHGDTGRPLTQTFKAHSGSCSLDFSPDGTTLATTSWDGTGLWSTETWQQVGSPIGCAYAHCIRYSPSGELLAIATYQNIQIWNPVTRQCIIKLAGGVPSASLVWTPDSARLLSADRDNTAIRQWDSSTWRQLSDIWKGSTGYPWWFAVNCNGTVVASPAAHNQVRLWRLSDRRTIAIFQHSDTPCCVTFSTDGKHILAGGKDNKVSEWAVPEHAWPEDAPRDFNTEAQDSDTKAQDSDTKAQYSDSETQDLATKVSFPPFSLIM
jgi:WD40 repeat protein